MTLDDHVAVENHGTIVILTPVSPEAEDWFSENVAQDGMRWAGGGAPAGRLGGVVVCNTPPG
jgi:hypothetical protein